MYQEVVIENNKEVPQLHLMMALASVFWLAEWMMVTRDTRRTLQMSLLIRNLKLVRLTRVRFEVPIIQVVMGVVLLVFRNILQNLHQMFSVHVTLNVWMLSKQ